MNGPAFGRRHAAKKAEQAHKPQTVAWTVRKMGATPAKSVGIVYATSASEAVDQAILERRADEKDRLRLVADRAF
jgi:hypothetical protein